MMISKYCCRKGKIFGIKCCKERKYDATTIKRMDHYTFMTDKLSNDDDRRFICYKQPIYIFQIIYFYWICVSKYLSGLFTAKLISNDMVIYWIHLWSTINSKFVYEYDQKTNEPSRIKGIIDDYSMWSSNKSVSEFWENTTFEILSVYIDYDDNCRIIFNLRNGEQIIEPRFDGNIDNLTKRQLDEIRVWNIVKAHYQCLISIYPALVHTWAHFHFNDLTLKYIEKYWDHDKKYSIMNRLIRSHTYYTSVLNGSGRKSGYNNPQMDEWNCCEFIFAPWKALPANSDIIIKHFVQDTNKHYFIDINNDYHNTNYNDEETLELIIQSEEDYSHPQQSKYQLTGISKISIKIPTNDSFTPSEIASFAPISPMTPITPSYDQVKGYIDQYFFDRSKLKKMIWRT